MSATILFISITTYSVAQVHIGVHAGWNYNSVKSENSIKPERNLSGWHLGLYSQIGITEKLYFIPTIQFSAHNYNFNIFTDDIQLGYVETPLLLSWRPVMWLAIETGPYFAFKVVTKSGSTHGDLEDVFQENIDIGNCTGLRFNVVKNLSVTARYWIGFIPIANTTLYDLSGQKISDIKLLNRTLGVSLAWKFDKASG